MFLNPYPVIDRFFHGKEATTNWFIVIIFLGLPALFSFYSMLVLEWWIWIFLILACTAASYVFNQKYGQKNFEQVKFWVRVPFFSVLFVAILLGVNYGYRGGPVVEQYKVEGLIYKGMKYELKLEDGAYENYQRFRMRRRDQLKSMNDRTKVDMIFERGALFGKFYKGDITWVNPTHEES